MNFGKIMAKKTNKYHNYDARTQNYMASVERFLQKKYGKIEAQWEGQLQLLAANYNLFHLANDIIARDGLMVPKPNGAFEKHPLLTQIAQSNQQIVKLVASFGLSPEAVGKIKQEEKDDSDIIANLLND